MNGAAIPSTASLNAAPRRNHSQSATSHLNCHPKNFPASAFNFHERLDLLLVVSRLFAMAEKSPAQRKREIFVAKITQIGSETYANATKSAVAAGYAPRTAGQAGSRLLKDRKIKAMIEARTAKQFGSIDYSAERVLTEMARLAFLDPRKFYDESGNLKGVQSLDDDTAACLAGLEVSEIYGQEGPIGVLKKIKFADKGANLERLGRYHKLFTDRTEHTGEEGGPIVFRLERIG